MAKSIRAVVLEFQPVDQGNLKGLFSIKIGPCTFRKCRLIQQPGAAPFCSPPQESYTSREGQRRFVTLVTWPSEWQDPVLTAMMEAQRDHPSGFRQIDTPTAFSQAIREKAGLGSPQGGAQS